MTAKKLKVSALTTPATTLVLRVCQSNMISSHGFTWPGVGQTATASDWKNTASCGNGLHGWLHGQGDHDAAGGMAEAADAKWLVVEVETDRIVHLGGKVKYPSGIVRAVGDRKHATDYLLAHDPLALIVAVIGAQLQVGDHASVTVGALGTATAGNSGTATAGYRGTATAGEYGTATAGYRGTATAGEYGTATAGNSGTATAGYRGTATAGEYGEVLIKWWDGVRYRTVIGVVGEGGIKADTPYQLDTNHKLVEVKKP